MSIDGNDSPFTKLDMCSVLRPCSRMPGVGRSVVVGGSGIFCFATKLEGD